MKNNGVLTRFLIFLIRKIWQGNIGKNIKKRKHIVCRFYPSCSEYAILCLKKYELIYALFKIRTRLFVTCKGFDYIMDDP